MCLGNSHCHLKNDSLKPESNYKTKSQVERIINEGCKSLQVTGGKMKERRDGITVGTTVTIATPQCLYGLPSIPTSLIGLFSNHCMSCGTCDCHAVWGDRMLVYDVAFFQ